MLTVKIQNDGTGTNEDANYNYKVFVNDKEISHGRVCHHNRDNGWAELVKAVAENEINWVKKYKKFMKRVYG
jgi:hypothetical protein